jgi:Response regulator containing CheY-like receiver domain and AraC-type DNA-binding domain
MRRVLIVDDEKFAVEGLLRYVDWAAMGVSRVLGAYSCKEAQGILEAEDFDVLVCDIEMPQGSGLDLVEWASQREGGMDAVFLTCHADFAYAQRALRLRSYDYLLKPVPYKKLEECLVALFERREAQAFAGSRAASLTDVCAGDIPAGAGGDRLPAPPDAMLWATLLASGSVDALREDALSYIAKLARCGCGGGIALRRFRQDFSQALYSGLKSRRISVHELFDDEKSVALESRAGDSLADLGSWVRYSLDSFEKELDELDRTGTVFERATRYIDRRVGEELSCAAIAEKVEVSPDHLSRLFKKETGLPLSEYVIRQHMRIARELLEKTSLPVGEIASRVGYTNFSHFSETFKRTEGVSPSQYRAQCKAPEKDGFSGKPRSEGG